jgi:membrane protein implicated in regulation of membrane protease activity
MLARLGDGRATMLIYLYVFALVLGGVLLGTSLLLGGHDDAGGDHGGGHEKEFHAGDVGADFFLWMFRSVRFWTFFLAFFGLTGVVLDGAGIVESRFVALVCALGMGALSGFGAASLIRFLSTDESGQAPESSDYVGKTVRVVVPVSRKNTGKVRLQLKGNTVDVLAVTDEEEFRANDEAIIIEMEGTQARIARVDKAER